MLRPIGRQYDVIFVTQQRALQVSIAAFALAGAALIVAGLYAAGIIGSGQKLAPTDRSSRTGSLRTEGNLHVDRNGTVSGTLDVTGPTTLNDLVANGAARLSSVHGTGTAQFESTLTATQGIFTVGSGRPPLVVNSGTLVPNLFANNSVLLAGQPSNFYVDVSGSGQSKAGALAVGSLTSGGLGVNGAGSVSGPFTVGGLTTLNGSLRVPGTATLGTLNTTGNGTIAGALSTGGNTTVGGNLTVSGSSTLAQLNLQNLTVASNAAVGGTLAVGGATAINNTLTVAGAATLRGGVSVTGDVNASGNVGAGGTVTAGNGLIATNGGLTVNGGGATIRGGVAVTGDANVSGNVGAGGTVTAGNGLIATNGGLTVNGGGATINGSSTVTGDLAVSGTTTLGPTSPSCPGGSPMTLNVCGDAQVSGNLTTGTLTNSGTFTVTGVINADGGISTSTSNGGPLNLTSANATVAVTGLLTASTGFSNTGTLTSVGGAVSLTGSPGNSVTIDASGTTVAGPVTANGGLTVNGAINTQGITNTGPLSSSGGVITLSDAANSVTVDGSGTTVTGVASLQGTTTVGTGCSSGAQLTICGDTNTSGQLIAGGISQLNGGITALSGTVTVTGNLTTGASNGTLTGFRLISTVASTCPLLGGCGLTPTPPVTVTSHDMVTNLNANYLEGHPAADFALSGGTAPATGSASYIQNCSVVGNGCPQAANISLTNTGLIGNPVTAVLTSTVVGKDALQVTGGATFNGTSVVNGTSVFNVGLATFNAGLTVASGPASFDGGIKVAQGGSTIFQTGANAITFGPMAPLATFTVNATTASINGDATITGNATITKDLIGGNFAGSCVVTAADILISTAQFTCQTQIIGAPRAVVITPGFNGGAFFVDTFAVAGPGPNLGKGKFVAHFPALPLVAGDTIYYVVVR